MPLTRRDLAALVPAAALAPTLAAASAAAIAYIADNTALPRHEVDRYISWPAQALSYYLGQGAILQARAKANATLGPKFDIRAFHDTVLQLGSVPLPILTRRIDRFIADGGPSPYVPDA